MLFDSAMKHCLEFISWFLAVILLQACVLSCQDGLSSGGSDNRPRVSVEFCVEPPLTKGAISDAGESAVNSIDLLVFRAATGTLDYRGRVTGTSYIQASLLANEELNWYIVANIPSNRFDNVTTESGFLATQTYLADTQAGSMVMGDSGTFTLIHSGTVQEIGPVVLNRYACKVSVEDITVDWLDSFASAPTCTVDRLLIMNARTVEPLSGIPSASADSYWVNKLTDEAVDSDPASMVGYLVYTEPDLSVTSSRTDLDAVMYCMPNPSTVDHNASDTPWDVRRSRVCVKLTIGGVSQWYPIELPSMLPNTHYIVQNLVIHGPGTAAPDMGIDRTLVSFSIAVAPWTDNDVNAGEIPLS